MLKVLKDLKKLLFFTDCTPAVYLHDLHALQNSCKEFEPTEIVAVAGERRLLTKTQNRKSLLIIQDPFIFEKLEVHF